MRLLNAENIFVWSGHNYAWEIVHQLGIPADEGVIRIGAAHYNTSAEIDETVAAVQRLVAMLRQQRQIAARDRVRMCGRLPIACGWRKKGGSLLPPEDR